MMTIVGGWMRKRMIDSKLLYFNEMFNTEQLAYIIKYNTTFALMASSI